MRSLAIALPLAVCALAAVDAAAAPHRRVSEEGEYGAEAEGAGNGGAEEEVSASTSYAYAAAEVVQEPALPLLPPSPPLNPAPAGLMYASIVTFQLELETDLASFMPFKSNSTATLKQQFPTATAVEITVSAGSAILDISIYFATTNDAQTAKSTLSTATTDVMANYLGGASNGVSVARIPEVPEVTTQNTLVSLPKPPSPPLPPLAPYSASVCVNTCTDSVYNGQCDDLGTENDGVREEGMCVTGTDCYDCGEARSVCEANQAGCTDQCRQEAYKRAKAGLSFCAASMLGDGECDADCNSYQCEHDAGDCGDDVATEACSLEHSMKPTYWGLQPGNYTAATQRTLGAKDGSKLAAVELRVVKFPPFQITSSSTEGVWKIDAQDIQLAMRWRDSRLTTAPCKLMLPSMFTLVPGSDKDNKDTRLVMEAKKKIIWFPQLSLEGEDLNGFLTNGPLKESAFMLKEGDEGGDWYNPSDINDGSSTCFDCAILNVTTKAKFDAYRGDMPSRLQFEYYPFDQQVFRMKFRVASSNIFSCTFSTFLGAVGNDPETAAKAMLPKTDEWTPISPFIEVRHASSTSDSADRTTCEVAFYVVRNYKIFLVKQVIMSVIVVYLGLASLYMNAADHTGDRAALIGVSALIVMFNFQTDLVIGTVTYLVWWDVFK